MQKLFPLAFFFVFCPCILIGQNCNGGGIASQVTLNLSGLTANGDIGEPGNSNGTICFPGGGQMSVVGDLVSNIQITTSNGSWCSEANIRFGNINGGASGWQFNPIFSISNTGPCGMINYPLDDYTSSGTPIFETDVSGCIHYHVFDILNDAGTAQDFVFDSGSITFYGCLLGALPVEWLSIDATRIVDKHVIEWSTATEINASHYVIERKLNNENDFKIISHRIAAQGNTTTKSLYSYDDEDVGKAGIYLYRVKQYDLDGNHNYSKSVSVIHSGDNKIDLFPNPAKELTNLLIGVNEISDVNIKIYDNMGKLVKMVTTEAGQIKGEHYYKIDLNGINSGQYTISINVGGVETKKKLIVLN